MPLRVFHTILLGFSESLLIGRSWRKRDQSHFLEAWVQIWLELHHQAEERNTFPALLGKDQEKCQVAPISQPQKREDSRGKSEEKTKVMGPLCGTQGRG
ncbi:hypothetical protein H8959_018312 [Pygathrix nigripes]